MAHVLKANPFLDNCAFLCALTSFCIIVFLMSVLSVRWRRCISRMEVRFHDLLIFHYLRDAYDFNRNNHVQN